MVDEKGQLRIRHRRTQMSAFQDGYHSILRMSWRSFFAACVVTYVLLNLCFAVAFWQAEGSFSGEGFRQAFNFSVQTFSTIGYGVLSPTDPVGNALVVLETLVSLLFTAVITGLAFSKFARPSSKVRFAQKMVLSTFDGKRALIVRVANARSSMIVEAQITLSFARNTTLQDGSTFRRITDLQLMRNTQPMFALAWTVVHFIDEESPLYGLSHADLKACDAVVIISLRGVDETFMQETYARHIYGTGTIHDGGKYADILMVDEDGERVIDYSRLDLIDS